MINLLKEFMLAEKLQFKEEDYNCSIPMNMLGLSAWWVCFCVSNGLEGARILIKKPVIFKFFSWPQPSNLLMSIRQVVCYSKWDCYHGSMHLLRKSHELALHMRIPLISLLWTSENHVVIIMPLKFENFHPTFTFELA